MCALGEISREELAYYRRSKRFREAVAAYEAAVDADRPRAEKERLRARAFKRAALVRATLDRGL